MTRLAIRTAVALVFGTGSIVAQEAAAARTWGTAAVSYTRVPAGAFYPALSSAGYGTAAFILRRWSNCSGVAFAGGLSFQSADLTPDDVTVDNLNDSYYVQVNGSDSSRPLAGLVVGYVLQVSPAPGTATFNDVPTGHLFFQYVEALAASGITAGCSAAPPLYCPDQPLTRGQMAVFLAKALGLQWP